MQSHYIPYNLKHEPINQQNYQENQPCFTGNYPQYQGNQTYFHGGPEIYQGNPTYEHGDQINYQESQQNHYYHPTYQQEDNVTPRYPFERYPPSANTPPRMPRYQNHPSRRTSKINSGRSNKESNVNNGEKVEKNHTQTEPVKLYCEPCKRDFTSADALKMHVKQHRVCEEDGCNFIASANALKLHFVQVHQEGRFKIVLESPEDIAKWREQRKRNWPTPENIEAKKQKIVEDMEDGIVVETKEFVYRERGEGRGKGKGRGRRNKGIKSKDPARNNGHRHVNDDRCNKRDEDHLTSIDTNQGVKDKSHGDPMKESQSSERTSEGVKCAKKESKDLTNQETICAHMENISNNCYTKINSTKDNDPGIKQDTQTHIKNKNKTLTNFSCSNLVLPEGEILSNQTDNSCNEGNICIANTVESIEKSINNQNTSSPTMEGEGCSDFESNKNIAQNALIKNEKEEAEIGSEEFKDGNVNSHSVLNPKLLQNINEGELQSDQSAYKFTNSAGNIVDTAFLNNKKVGDEVDCSESIKTNENASCNVTVSEAAEGYINMVSAPDVVGVLKHNEKEEGEIDTDDGPEAENKPLNPPGNYNVCTLSYLKEIPNDVVVGGGGGGRGSGGDGGGGRGGDGVGDGRGSGGGGGCGGDGDGDGETMEYKDMTNASLQHKKKPKRSKNKHSKKSKKKAKMPPPEKKVSLLEMLLANEIRHERNVILQCIRYIVKHNFFDS